MKLSPRIFWEKQTSRLQWRWNLGLWLDRWLKATFVSGGILCPLVILLRRWQPSTGSLWPWIVLVLAAVFVGSFFWAQKIFLNRDQSRVELEERLAFNNRLTASFQGVGDYPPVPERTPDLPGFQWRKLAPAPLGVLLLLILALKIPVKSSRDEETSAYSKPPGLEKVESWVKELKKQDLVEPEALQKLEQQTAELAGREGKEWYRHGSLEAIDRLEEKTRAAMQSMEQNLGEAQKAASEMKEAGMRGEESLDSTKGKLSLALRGLEQKPLPLNPELAKRLKALGEGGMKEMSAEQLGKMLEKMKSGQSSLQSSLGSEGALHKFPTEGKGDGEGEGEGEGTKEGPGKGGVARGPGTAPITLTRNESKTDGISMEGLAQTDMKRAALGSLLGVTNGRHGKAEELKQSSAGVVEGKGEGGQSVLEDQLTPSEREFLKAFYQ